jgi:hypothetical protein
MKAPFAVFAIIIAGALTACGGVDPYEVDNGEAALLGVEPDEIDIRDTDEDTDDVRAPDPEADGVEPDEIDYCDTDEDTDDVRAPDQEVDGVEPDEIDYCDTDEGTDDGRASDTGSRRGTHTYGPVITIKPKG